ncbi:MAG TPA: GrpB family protein [Phycisphaerales bacterium]
MATQRELLTLVPARPAARAAERLFRWLRLRIARRVPGAVILHIGATALRGLPTKGDLDIVVRVHKSRFDDADRALSALFTRNLESDRNASFASFQDDASVPPLGVQLVVIGSEHDDFHVVASLMAADPALRRRVAMLKRRFDGRSMERYRAAKGKLLDGAAQGAAVKQRDAGTGMPSRVRTD